MEIYNDNYYAKKIRQYNYDTDFDLKNVSDLERQKMWIASSNLKNGNNLDLDKTLVTLGIGINGVPHLGTINQILRAIFLQKRGYYVQIVLGDLDVYGARKISIDEMDELLDTYKNFIINLGFDLEKGVIRNQRNHSDILLTSYMISPYIDDSDFLDLEEEINDFLMERKKFSGMSFSVKSSYSLEFADFIHPCLNDNYNQVIFTCGIDEAQYGWKANQILKRMGYKSKNISTISSRLIGGLNGNPKMGKSLTNSGITVLTDKSQLENIILNLIREGNINMLLDIISTLAIYDIKYLEYINNLSLQEKNKLEKEVLSNFTDELNNILNSWQKKKGVK